MKRKLNLGNVLLGALLPIFHRSSVLLLHNVLTANPEDSHGELSRPSTMQRGVVLVSVFRNPASGFLIQGS